MAIRYPSIREIAEQVLREVDAEEQIKTAERHAVRDAAAPKVHSDLAKDLQKVAALCRSAADEDPVVTVDDLKQFMAQVNR